MIYAVLPRKSELDGIGEQDGSWRMRFDAGAG
jgi:hypothetical protein